MSNLLDLNDPRNRATMAYHRLIKKGDHSEAVIRDLTELLEISNEEINAAVVSMFPAASLAENELNEVIDVARINTISAKIDTLIGPEGLAIVEIITALERPTPKWLLEQPQSDKTEVANHIINELHGIRDSQLSLTERANCAYKVFASYRKQLPAVTFAQQRIEDTIAKYQLTQGMTPST